jgi:integrase
MGLGMKNQRGQRGSIRVESGSWVGYWNTYQYNPETDENVRKQRSKVLGPKSLSKHQAYKVLSSYIEQSAHTVAAHRPDGAVTLEVFTRSRWVPLKEGGWRSFTNDKGRVVNPAKASAECTLGHIFEKFGRTPLEKFDKVMLQSWLNEFAKTNCESEVRHCKIYLKSILDEAVEQDYLRKNPARKLILPQTREVDKSILSQDQLEDVIAELDEKHALLVDVCSGCAMRPSELLALRWRDFDPVARTFTIRWTIVRGVLRPFTKNTKAGSKEVNLLRVVIPDALVKDLIAYRARPNGLWTGDDHFIFSTKEGTIMHKENILHRVLEPVRAKLKLPVLNFQVLRRSTATESQQDGSVKDIQTQLRHRGPNVAAEEYIQPIDASTRKMVNTTYDRQRSLRKRA